LHAAHFVVLRGAQHAALGVGLLRVVRGLRQDHALAVEPRLLRVHQAVEGRVLLACDALAGVEHGVKGFAAVVGKTFARLQRRDTEPLVEQKIKGGTQTHGTPQPGSANCNALRRADLTPA
jgi:hypothetical protein